jgi:hypothetical protein
VNRITRLIFGAASGLDCLSGSVACPGLVLVLGGFVARSRGLVGHPFGPLVWPVFPGGRLLFLSRGGSRPDGSRPAA